MILDAHTHSPPPGAIVDTDPVTDPDPARLPGIFRSAGIHPWNTPLATPETIAAVDRLVGRPDFIAVGETGLDALRGGDLDAQERLFRAHIDIAIRHGLPLIIHAVKATDRLLRIRRDYPGDTIPWIIHGFRGKPQLARQLVDHGFYLSFGPRANRESVLVTPPSRRLVETDDTTLPIADVYTTLGLTPSDTSPLFRHH